MTQAEQRVKELHDLLHYHNHRYYVLDDPALPDGEYDKLFQELQQLEIMSMNKQLLSYNR